MSHTGVLRAIKAKTGATTMELAQLLDVSNSLMQAWCCGNNKVTITKEQKDLLQEFLDTRIAELSSIQTQLENLPLIPAKKVRGTFADRQQLVYAYTNLIYGIVFNNRIKIGHTTNPVRRLETYKVHLDAKIEYHFCRPGSLSDEQHLHKLLSPWRIDREWYDFTADVKIILDDPW